jgi:hypothetical protein
MSEIGYLTAPQTLHGLHVQVLCENEGISQRKFESQLAMKILAPVRYFAMRSDGIEPQRIIGERGRDIGTSS